MTSLQITNPPMGMRDLLETRCYFLATFLTAFLTVFLATFLTAFLATFFTVFLTAFLVTFFFATAIY